MPWKSAVVAAGLMLGAANTTTPAAFGRGMSGGAHFVGGGFASHKFAFAPRHALTRPFRRNFATGGFWPYYYDYFPTDAYGAADTTTYPGTLGFAPEPILAPVCHRSEEIVRVPSEAGGTREIRITRCP
jgi:hypothetical protein